MEEKNEIKVISIEPPDDILCPYCGRNVVPEDEVGGYEIEPCEHLSFICFQGEQIYVSEKYGKGFEQLLKRSEEGEGENPGIMSYKERLPAMGYDPDRFTVVEYCVHGIACGPVSYCTDHGFCQDGGEIPLTP